MRGIRLETGQELFLGNCRLVILSEPAASERTAEVVDYLLSDHELRPGTPLYLTEGEAAELLESPELPAEQLSEMMRSAAEAGLCPDSTLLTVVRSLESLGSTAALGRIDQYRSLPGMEIALEQGIADIAGGPVLELRVVQHHEPPWLTVQRRRGQSGCVQTVENILPAHRVRTKAADGTPVFHTVTKFHGIHPPLTKYFVKQVQFAGQRRIAHRQIDPAWPG